ncbi:23.6 kDa heat shock protein, mitochondrial-like [Chenopodium quinoa]|nr:23.6 kDa heat shock protein, mitochondrial-like [Chenopodium quinoa]
MARVSLCRNNLLSHRRFSSAPPPTAAGIPCRLLANCKLARSGNIPDFDGLPPHCLLRAYKYGASQFQPVGGLRKNSSFYSDTDDDDSSSDNYSDSDQDLPNTWRFKQDDDAVYLRMDVPGVGKEDVKVYVVGSSHMLKVKGIRKLDPEFGDNAETGPKPFLYEVGLMSLSEYKVDKIKAEVKDGVLKVTVPKVKDEERTDMLHVQVD